MSLLLILAYTGSGSALMLLGWRGARVPSGPRCAACNYDLRGIAQLQTAICSECGSDLSRPRATTRSEFQRRPWWMLAGAAIISIPWLLFLVSAFLTFAGSHWERFRSNRSIISAVAADNQATWGWTELEIRLTAGKLSKQETSDAIDLLTDAMQHSSVQASWGQSFFRRADDMGFISSEQYLNFARAYCGSSHLVDFPEKIPADQTAWFNFDSNHFGPLPGYQLLYSARDIRLADASVDPLYAGPFSRLDHARPRSDNLALPGGPVFASSPGQMDEPTVVPGHYQATVVVDIGMVPAGSNDDRIMTRPGQQPGWHSARAQWTETLAAPVEVTSAVGPYVHGRPDDILQIVTDPKLDPQATGAISISEVNATCFKDRTLLMVVMTGHELPIDCFMDASIKVGDGE